MDAQARAGIDVQGAVLRYAEVERYGARYRLLRLGSCDFDFDVAREVLRTEDPAHLHVVADALGDVFEGSTAARLHVAFHPPEGYSFFSPLPARLTEADRLERLRYEAGLLVDAEDRADLHLEVDLLYTEAHEDDGLDWYHVLALEAPIYTRFERILGRLPQVDCRLSLSTHGAAAVITHLRERAGRPARFTLGIGFYETHTEYTLCREDHWYFSHYAAVQAPADCAYFAALLLRHLGLTPANVGQLFLYGGDVGTGTVALLQSLFRAEVERLNPIQVVDLDPGSLSARFDASAYVPCIGVAL